MENTSTDFLVGKYHCPLGVGEKHPKRGDVELNDDMTAEIKGTSGFKADQLEDGKGTWSARNQTYMSMADGSEGTKWTVDVTVKTSTGEREFRFKYDPKCEDCKDKKTLIYEKTDTHFKRNH